MKKHLKKLRPLLLLTVLFMFTNCQEELEENKPAVQQKNGSKYTILTGEAARTKKAELLVKLNNDGGKGLSKLQSVLKGGNTDPAFRELVDIKEYIDDSEIFKVEQTNGNINYTYRVNMPDAADNKFYNLVVKTSGSAEKTVLITYSLDKELSEGYQLDGDLSKFTGEIEFDVVAMSEGFPCEEEPRKPTRGTNGSGSGAGGVIGGSGGGNGGGGIGGPVNPGNPGVPYNQLLVDIKINALKIIKAKSYSIEVGPIEGGIDGGGTIPGTFPGTFDRYIIQTPSVNGETIPCGDGEDIGILAQQKNHEDNCDELKKFIQNAKNLASLRNVEQTSTNDKENGYSYSEDKDPVVLKQDPVTEDLVEVPTGGLIYGASHDHPDPVLTQFIPMFSVSDIVMLGKIRSTYFNPGHIIDNNKFIFTLTVNKGGSKQTFALKIENWAFFDMFLTKYAGLTSLEKKKLGSRLAFDYSYIGQGASTDQYLGILFKFMDKNGIKGVSIYKANNDFSSWTKLSYDQSTKSVKETPCK